jgi:hypothetical protein
VKARLCHNAGQLNKAYKRWRLPRKLTRKANENRRKTTDKESEEKRETLQKNLRA